MDGRAEGLVEFGDSLDRVGIVRTKDYPVGVHEVADGGPFAKEFGVGYHRDHVVAAAPRHALNQVTSADRYGALVHNDRIGAQAAGHRADGVPHPAEVCRPFLRTGSVDRNEHDLGVQGVWILAHEPKSAARNALRNQRVESRFEDRAPSRVVDRNSVRIYVDAVDVMPHFGETRR